MTTLIGVALLLPLAYTIVRRLFGHAPRQPVHRNPVLARLTQDLADDRDAGREAREGELAHQLLSGRIDSASYREEMSDLTHPATPQVHEQPTVGDDGHRGQGGETPDSPHGTVLPTEVEDDAHRPQ
jgi:hypothetical protein